MRRKNKDETRWLARLIAVYMLIFVVDGIVVNLSTIFSSSQDSAGLVWATVGLGLGILFLWLAFCLLTCSSFWDFFGFLEKYPLVAIIQCRYFAVNRHIRSGWTGGAIMLLMVYPLVGLIRMSEGTWFSTAAMSVLDFLLWPFRAAGGFQLEPRGLVFAMLMVYCVGTGFAAGAGLSLAAGVLAETSCDSDMPE